MSQDRITPATESVSLPKPSIAPAFFAFGLMLAVAGTYLVFMGPNWAYVVIGGLAAFFAAASMIKGAVRSYHRLPRRQEASTSPLPIEFIEPPTRK